MPRSVNILSTKKLDNKQLSLFKNSGINIIDVDFIKIKSLVFNTEKLKNGSKNWIITSKNSIEILLDTFPIEFLNTISFYCVGDKTKSMIETNGLNVVVSKLTSKALGESILEKNNTLEFIFIAGSYRRAELPSILENNNIEFTEFIIYETILSPHKIEDSIDGILFYSPSGIKSYLLKNIITSNQNLFCIGNTTAQEAKKHSQNINIATEQTFESVLALTKQNYA